MKPKFFASSEQFRRWLEKYHDKRSELTLGFYKKGSGKRGITWPESVVVALCFGWIDGVRRRVDDVSYAIRFTPRKPGSIWSAVNSKRAAELSALGLMHASGAAAFAARRAERSGVYSFEQGRIAFESAQEKLFRAHKDAWQFFAAQANWYRRAATWWAIGAKREATRDKRLRELIEESAAKRTLKHLTRRRD